MGLGVGASPNNIGAANLSDHHKSVIDSPKITYVGKPVTLPNGWQTVGPIYLGVELDLEVATETQLDKFVTVVDLAKKVLDFWESHPDLSQHRETPSPTAGTTEA